MFSHLRAKKISKVIAMSNLFPKNQSPEDAKLVKNIKMTNLLFFYNQKLIFYYFLIKIVSFKINMLFNSCLPNGATS